MQRLSEIKAAYDWFFKHYRSEVDQRARQNDIPGIVQMNNRRDILERSVFVLMFGQFEIAVNSIFEAAREARTTNSDWSRRRGWDTASVNGRKVPFDTKLAMVLDRNSASFGKIMATYSTRNHCAHGGTANAVGSIDSLYADLFQWQSELQV